MQLNSLTNSGKTYFGATYNLYDDDHKLVTKNKKFSRNVTNETEVMEQIDVLKAIAEDMAERVENGIN